MIFNIQKFQKKFCIPYICTKYLDYVNISFNFTIFCKQNSSLIIKKIFVNQFFLSIFVFFYFILIISCINDKHQIIHLDFNKKYFDLLKEVKIDTLQHYYKCKTTLDDKEFYFDALISNINKNFIMDNIMSVNVGNKDMILLNMELIYSNNYDLKIQKIFDKNLKTINKNLNIMFFYDDNALNDNKNKVLNSIFRYINKKNDSISLEKFKKKYNLLNTNEVEKIKTIFNPIFLFSSYKHENPPQSIID